MRRRRMNEHIPAIVVGLVLVGVSILLPQPLGVIATALGMVSLAIGVIGAGVQAGTREVVEELRLQRIAGERAERH